MVLPNEGQRCRRDIQEVNANDVDTLFTILGPGRATG